MHARPAPTFLRKKSCALAGRKEPTPVFSWADKGNMFPVYTMLSKEPAVGAKGALPPLEYCLQKPELFRLLLIVIAKTKKEATASCLIFNGSEKAAATGEEAKQVSLFNMPVGNLKGVGPKRARLFEKIGAPSVGALLRLYPRAYEDMTHPFPIRQAPLNEPCAVRAILYRAPVETRVRGGMLLCKCRASDGESDLELTFFNNPYVKDRLLEGETYLFYGKVSSNFLKREMLSPEFYPAASCPPIIPIYRQTQGLSSRMIANAVKNAFLLLPQDLRDPIPEELRARHRLLSLREALETIHFARTLEELKEARRRMIFEELLVLQLGLLRMKSREREYSALRLTEDDSEAFYQLLPFVPTNAQKRAVREATADMMGGYPMNRLVQGDVGSGKTAVAAALCYSVVENGMQAALMAPTEILARQHYETLSAMFAPTGIPIALLTGSLTPSRKKKLSEQLQSGEIRFVIGTHALLSEGVSFQKLGLVVTDEQHRFGVAQRAALASKGDNLHLLVMSATPIPRTLALMIYGDLDLSVLDELPPGRQKIETYAIDSSKRMRAFRYMQKHIDQGLQCYIICPTIEEGENDMAAVTQYAEKLRTEWMPGCRIGMLHGRMKAREKEEIMSQFAAGEIDVLVSTTVVEVGVDVPNAVVMLIENAERYGLSQLHQLRGRVGRGKHRSTCILLSDAQNEEALARLQVMCRTSNGFEIADEDLRLRGPGDFFGSRQHGLPDLKIADMAQDMETLKQAQEAAREILAQDFPLDQPEHRGLRAEVNQLFQTLSGG